MAGFNVEELRQALAILFALMALSLGTGLVLLVWVLWRVRRIHLPPDADFVTALRATPFVVVVLLDLLDFGLDFLSIPIAWVVLGRLGLAPLRTVTILEEVIPGTQMLPTMTVAWLGVRLLGRTRTASRRWAQRRWSYGEEIALGQEAGSLVSQPSVSSLPALLPPTRPIPWDT